MQIPSALSEPDVVLKDPQEPKTKTNSDVDTSGETTPKPEISEDLGLAKGTEASTVMFKLIVGFGENNLIAGASL